MKHKLVHLEKLWDNFYNENCLEPRKWVATFDNLSKIRYKIQKTFRKYPYNFTLHPPEKYHSLKHKLEKLLTSILNSGALTLRILVKNNFALYF